MTGWRKMLLTMTGIMMVSCKDSCWRDGRREKASFRVGVAASRTKKGMVELFGFDHNLIEHSK